MTMTVEERAIEQAAKTYAGFDKSVDIDLVIQVIDAAKAVGIEKFTIETEKQSF